MRNAAPQAQDGCRSLRRFVPRRRLLLVLSSLSACSLVMAACKLVDLSGLATEPADSSSADAHSDPESGPGPSFCIGHVGSALCDDFEHSTNDVGLHFEDRSPSGYEVIRDPDNPANRVLSVRYDAQASGGGVQLKHRESSALNASRVELTFRFRLLSCTSDYAAFGFIQLRRASQTMNVGLAGYEWCKIVSTETTINGKDASILSGDTEWHTAALTLTRGSGADTGAVSVDGRLLYQFQQPSAAFDSCELSIGSFFTSSQGAVQVMFDNVLAVITP